MKRPEKLKEFIRMILDKAEEGDLVRLCEFYGISLLEMDDCLKYLESKEGMNIRDL